MGRSGRRLKVAGREHDLEVARRARQVLRQFVQDERTGASEPLNGRRERFEEPNTSPGGAMWVSNQLGASMRAVARALRIAVIVAKSSSNWTSSSRSRSPAPGQRATMSSSGSDARCGIAAHSASVTNGMTGCSSRR